MPAQPNFPQMEEEILAFWKREKIFEQTLAKKSPQGDFVFYEGPPTANGKPGIHHIEARAYKDVIPRYKTMRGYHVERKAGWDTHGLPVELQVEKLLKISGKKQIESLKATPEESIAFFNQKCRESVWEYLREWEKSTERIGFWEDMEHPYVTYENSYIETLWHIIKRVYDKGLLEKDYKVVPYCPRCGTPLSSHELAQGYDEAEDPSIYVKFQIPNPKSQKNSNFQFPTSNPIFFLVWTTTPWTLPGNVALAVKEDAEYALVEVAGEHLILAKERLSSLGDTIYAVKDTCKGKDLVGLEYEPLYSFVKYDQKAHYVAAADFVSLEDGTGIVHTAVMYGVDDFELGTKLGLPKKHLVDPEGKFIPEVKPWAGMFVKDADPKIMENLEARGLMFRQETIKHTYPFCWRCDTPLIYYARDSWFIRMTKLKDSLIRANKGINWVPSHVRDGRFGEFLRELKDWAFSRERYWGTPLPIWICDACGEKKVIGSFEDFPRTPSGNTYFLMRHGMAEHNVQDVFGGRREEYHLTPKGKKDIAAAAKKLGQEKIDLILTSDIARARETAAIVAEHTDAEVQPDERLRERFAPQLDGKPVVEFLTVFPNLLSAFDQAPDGAESSSDILKRVFDLFSELEKKYQNKKILLVSHGDPLWVMEGVLRGMSRRGMVEWGGGTGHYIKQGEVRAITPKLLPRGPDGLVDPHRPYIDRVTFTCDACGKVMRRIKEVSDVWFDSGSMPFAQEQRSEIGGWRSETEGRSKQPRLYPADYISEAVDQTRGWFYTLLAVATLLDFPAPYKNVIVLGIFLDKNGQKMSKSRGNIIDPQKIIDHYGADTLRWWMYTVNQPIEDKRFDEQELAVIQRQTFMILWNVLSFYKMYATGQISNIKYQISNVLDQWIVSKLHTLVKETTDHLEHYRLTEATRGIASFITDLSTWYVRRSRERFKAGDASAIAVLRQTLETLAHLMAPFTPFLAEKIFQSVFASPDRDRDEAISVETRSLPPRQARGRADIPSVHLADWPKADKKLIDQKLLDEMKLVRNIVERGHAARAAAKIKVRQPLAKLTIVCTTPGVVQESIEILKDELNVKAVEFHKGKALEVALDTAITPALKHEGAARDIIRTVNDLRKQAGLTPQDRIALYYDTADPFAQETIKELGDEIKRATRASTLSFRVRPGGREISPSEVLTLDTGTIWLGIAKTE